MITKELPQTKIQLQHFTLDQAYQLAEETRRQMALGDFPASQLIDILQDCYGVKFIVDHAEIKPSGACFRSEKGCFIFINGCNAESRQLFSIAHELFHLITWDPEMLSHVEKDQQLHAKNEMLADAFAAGLLIPQEKLQMESKKICADRFFCVSDVLALAQQFQVSKEAMSNRMRNVNLISKTEFDAMREQMLQISSAKMSTPPSVHPLKSKFVRLVYLACEHVKISRAKAAKLLNVDLCDLSSQFNEYGFAEIPC